MGLGRGLAAFVAGAGSGYLKGQETARKQKIEDEDIAYRNEQRDRLRVQQGRDDRVQSGLDEADRAFADTIKSFSSPQLSPAPIDTQAPDILGNPAPQMSRDPGQNPLAGVVAPPAAGGAQSIPPTGGPMGAPATPQPGAVQMPGPGGKPTTLNQQAPDPRILTAMQARTDVLLRHGLLPQYQESWMKTAEMRAKVRASEFAGADKEYAMTGDPSVYAKRIYPLIADGHDFVSSQTVTGSDGKPVMQITRRSQDDGKESTVEISPERFLRTVEIARDPAAVLAMEAARAKKVFETNEEIRRDKEKETTKGAEDRKTEEVKGVAAAKLEDTKNTHRLGQIGKEKGMEGGNQIALEREKQAAPVTLAEGQDRFAPQRQKDGSITYVPIAKGRDKTSPASRATDSQLSAIAISNFGDNDPVSGRKIGNDRTAKIAAAARDIQEANPGLDANRAIQQAAAELAKPRGSK